MSCFLIQGVFRAIPRRLNPKQRTVSSVFKTYIDCIHIRRCDVGIEEASNTTNSNTTNTTTNDNNNNNNTSQEAEILQSLSNNNDTSNENNNNNRQFTKDRIKQFQDFATQGNCYERLV